MKKSIARLAVSLPIGLVLIAVGIIVWFTVNTAIKDTVGNAAIILPENDKSDLINPWTRFVSNVGDENNQRMYEYYVYNLTNPIEVVQGEDPIYKEVGPYKYQYYFKKLNLKLIEDDEVVQYQNWKYYVPIVNDPTSLDPTVDQVYHVNLAYMAAVKQLGSETSLGAVLAGSGFPTLAQQLNSPSLKFAIGTIYSTTILKNLFTALVGYYTANPPAGGQDPLYYACATWGGNTDNPPTGIPIPPAFYYAEASPAAPLALDLATCQQLFDSTKPFAFTNTAQTAYGAWLQATTNTTAMGAIYGAMGQGGATLTQPQFQAVVSWASKFKNGFSVTTAIAQQPICQSTYACTTDDFGMIQWGTKTGFLQGTSIQTLAALPIKPEFGLQYDIDLSIDQIKYLWNNQSALSLMTGTKFATLAGLVKAQAATVIAAQSSNLLTLPIAGALVQYMFAFSKAMAYPQLLQLGGGPIVKHTVNDYMFHYNDPLLMVLYPTNPAKWNAAPLSNYTTQEAAEANLPTDKSLTGKNDAVLSQSPLTYHGHETVQYQDEIKVTGHNSENMGPFYLHEDDAVVQVFSEEYARALNFDKEFTDNTDGVKYFRYRIADSDWQINPEMFTTIPYLMNLTSAMGVPVCASRPRLKGIDTSYLTKTSLNYLFTLTEDNDVFADYEPNTGKAIRGRYSIQVNYYMEGQNGKNATLFDFFNTFAGDVIHPLVWGKNEVDATADQLKLIRTSYRVDAFRYALTIILIVIGSILVVSVIGLYLIDSLEAKGFFN